MNAGLLADRHVFIDPGHNGGNAQSRGVIGRLITVGNITKPCDEIGAATPSGYTESAFNLDTSRRLQGLLLDIGCQVTLSRSSDDGEGPCVDDRARLGNASGADIAISIHADGAPREHQGFHILCAATAMNCGPSVIGRSIDLARRIVANYSESTSIPMANYVGCDGVSLRSDLIGLALSRIPKVVIEAGNMNNPIDAQVLESVVGRQSIAEAIARGIAEFFMNV